MTTKYRRPGCLVTLPAGAAIGLEACSGSSAPPAASPPTVASLPSSTSAGPSSGQSGVSSTTTPLTDNATALVDEWATCMRNHGDPDQADPTIDANKDININWNPAINLGAGGDLNPSNPTFQHVSKFCARNTGAHVPGAGGPPEPGTIRLEGAGPLPNAGAGANG